MKKFLFKKAPSWYYQLGQQMYKIIAVYFILCPLLFFLLDILFNLLYITNGFLQLVLYMGLFYFFFPKIEAYFRR